MNGCDRRTVITHGSALALAYTVLNGSAARSAISPTPVRKGPFAIRSVETVWVPVRDGTRLAVRLILPDGVKEPVPAVMTYWPYRRRDMIRSVDESIFYDLASHGYACVCPDLRGSGDSEGVLKDEYLSSEQSDGVDLIAWIAAQPWCSGKVGMTGLSWAGFSTLQVAALRPPALKAAIVHGCSDDRYTDDAHYLGGAVSQDMFVWGSQFYALQAFPPDPAVVGERWREMWRSRCESIEFKVADWIRHQWRDEFWKHGSINQDYEAIKCPVYAIDGWTDAYPNSVPRLMEHLKVPRKALLGPWGHSFPHTSAVGPKIDYGTEARRWWDYWLKGIDTGIMAEPEYRAWMADDAAHHGLTDIPGHWVAEAQWPSPSIRQKDWHLTPEGLAGRPGKAAVVSLRPDQTVGSTAGHWCPAGGGDQGVLLTELPTDQQIDDARSLTFDSSVLDSAVEILGFPSVTLDIVVDQPVAMIAVRLNEVFADGTSRRVSYGILNLTHRDSHEHPTPLVPGQRYRVSVQLKNCGYAFKPGNRIRVAISTSYWPLIIPPPRPVMLKVHLADSVLSLPVRPARSSDASLAPFGRANVPDTTHITEIKADPVPRKTVSYDIATETQTISSQSGGGVYRIDGIDTELSGESRSIVSISKDDPCTARGEYYNVQRFRRDSDRWNVRIESKTSFHVTDAVYHVEGTITAFDGSDTFFQRDWKQDIPRMLS